MGRDIAGRKDRDGRMSGCQAQIVGGGHVAHWFRFGGGSARVDCSGKVALRRASGARSAGQASAQAKRAAERGRAVRAC